MGEISNLVVDPQQCLLALLRALAVGDVLQSPDIADGGSRDFKKPSDNSTLNVVRSSGEIQFVKLKQGGSPNWYL